LPPELNAYDRLTLTRRAAAALARAVQHARPDAAPHPQGVPPRFNPDPEIRARPEGWHDMRQEQTKKLHRHWRTLWRNGAPPDRNDIEPAAIAPALQDVFILGRGPDGLWRYRVAGTRLAAYADRDLRGELFTGWWRPHDQMDIARLLTATASERTPVVGGVSALSTRRERHALEFILLPLRHGGQDGRRMIGGLFPAPETARLFDMRIGELAVTSLRNLDDAPARAESFGRPRADIEALMERRHGLRVIAGGRA
jgi:hypothetical protein